MTKFYTTTHRDEDLQALEGERFDAITEHMVKYRGYDLNVLKAAISGKSQVIWEMHWSQDRKYYVFGQIVVA